MNPARRGTPDFVLLFLTIALVGFGLVMVFSASYSMTYLKDPLLFTKKQIQSSAIGLVAMFILMNTPYLRLKKWFIPFFLLTVVLLVLVLLVGDPDNLRSGRGISIGPLGGQPTEFAKIGVIAYLATMIARKEDKLKDFKTGLLPVIIVLSFVCGLILLQPDLGSMMILLLASAVVILVGGARWKHMFLLAGSGAAVGAIFIIRELLKQTEGGKVSFRFTRLTSYLDPWSDPIGSGYHLIQSLYAFGHGGLTGAGFGQGIQKLHYLPESHNDFIFAVIGEELGFIGAAIFLLIYMLFIWRALMVAIRCQDLIGTLIGTGVVSLIAIQALINIGGVTGAIPITGVPLPLISYGGSSMLATLLAIGIILSISRDNNRPNEQDE